MNGRVPSQTISGAYDSWRTASTGLQEMRSDQEQIYVGLRTVIVFGSSTVDILKKLEGTIDEFSDWYAGWTRRIKDDPVAAAFLSLRDLSLKRILPIAQIDQVLSQISSAGSYVDMAEHYLRLLGEMLADAKRQFGSATQQRDS